MHRINYAGSSCQAYGELPSVGSRAPDVSLVNTDLQDVSFANFMGMRKVLNIFSSIDTSVCAKSVIVFNKIAENHDDVAMLMVSYNLPFAHARFHTEHSLENVIGLSAIRHAGFGENYGVQIIEGRFAACFPEPLSSSTRTIRWPTANKLKISVTSRTISPPTRRSA